MRRAGSYRPADADGVRREAMHPHPLVGSRPLPQAGEVTCVVTSAGTLARSIVGFTVLTAFWQDDNRTPVLSRNVSLDAQQLVSLISDLIAPQTWGTKTSEPYIRSFSGRLIIQQDHATHVKIGQMLEKLNLQYSDSTFKQIGGSTF